MDNVETLDIVLYDGTRMTVGRTSDDELEAAIAAGGRRGEIYAGLRGLRDRYAESSVRSFRGYRGASLGTTWMTCCRRTDSTWQGH